MKSDAYLSTCRQYRYWLLRVWDESKPVIAFIGVNPSTADEHKDDPTIRREIGFASRWGFGGLLKLNVGGYRATDPRKWRRAADPIGIENSAKHLAEYVERFKATKIVAAWGKNGNYFVGRCEAIVSAFPETWCLGRNGDGTPRHPLMLSYSVELERFSDEKTRVVVH